MTQTNIRKVIVFFITKTANFRLQNKFKANWLPLEMII